MFERLVVTFEKAITWFAGAALGLAVLYVVMAIIGPRLGLELSDEDLLVAEAVVLLAFLPQLYLARGDRQISVDLFVMNLSPRIQRGLEGFGAFCGMLSFGLLGLAAWYALDRALLFGSVNPGDLELPTWPARLMVLLGCSGGFLGCLLHLISLLRPQRN